MTKPDAPARSLDTTPHAEPDINLLLMIQQHSANRARALRRSIARHEAALREDRAELERVILHAGIEGVAIEPDVSPAEPTPAEAPQP